MKRRHAWKLSLLIAVPLILFAVVRERNSWRPKTLKVGAGYSAFQVTFSFDSRRLAVACDNTSPMARPDKLMCWDTYRRNVLWNFATNNGQLASITFLPDSHEVASLDWHVDNRGVHKFGDSDFDTAIRLHESHAGKVRRTLHVGKDNEYAQYLCIWPNKTTLFHNNMGYRLTDLPSGKTREWRLNRDALKHYVTPPCEISLGSFALAPDGRTLAAEVSDSCNNTTWGVALFDSHTRRLRRLLSVPRTSDNYQLSYAPLAFSPDSRLLALNGYKETKTNSEYYVQVWDVRTAKLHQLLACPEGFAGVLAFAPDNETLAASDDTGHIYLWNVSSRALLRTLYHSKDQVFTLAFSPDGYTLASGSAAGTVKLWRIK